MGYELVRGWPPGARCRNSAAHHVPHWFPTDVEPTQNPSPAHRVAQRLLRPALHAPGLRGTLAARLAGVQRCASELLSQHFRHQGARRGSRALRHLGDEQKCASGARDLPRKEAQSSRCYCGDSSRQRQRGGGHRPCSRGGDVWAARGECRDVRFGRGLRQLHRRGRCRCGLPHCGLRRVADGTHLRFFPGAPWRREGLGLCQQGLPHV
mmetsp:Transcript_54302/g.137689  ORF Transcript_54302/g.137689 Transcript_54302/m.137689 type:complete len:209 (+) Transcript_54302:398-1024(+)